MNIFLEISQIAKKQCIVMFLEDLCSRPMIYLANLKEDNAMFLTLCQILITKAEELKEDETTNKVHQGKCS